MDSIFLTFDKMQPDQNSSMVFNGEPRDKHTYGNSLFETNKNKI